MAEEEKRVIVPRIDVAHNDKDTGLKISVNLAGVPKESVELEMGKEGFCLKAEAEQFKYETCFMLAHRIKHQETKAKFESGLLYIDVPFDETMHGYKVPIE
jgi:HSP20 family molecular chaperone IbpA